MATQTTAVETQSLQKFVPSGNYTDAQDRVLRATEPQAQIQTHLLNQSDITTYDLRLTTYDLRLTTYDLRPYDCTDHFRQFSDNFQTDLKTKCNIDARAYRGQDNTDASARRVHDNDDADANLDSQEQQSDVLNMIKLYPSGLLVSFTVPDILNVSTDVLISTPVTQEGAEFQISHNFEDATKSEVQQEVSEGKLTQVSTPINLSNAGVLLSNSATKIEKQKLKAADGQDFAQQILDMQEIDSRFQMHCDTTSEIIKGHDTTDLIDMDTRVSDRTMISIVEYEKLDLFWLRNLYLQSEIVQDNMMFVYYFDCSLTDDYEDFLNSTITNPLDIFLRRLSTVYVLDHSCTYLEDSKDTASLIFCDSMILDFDSDVKYNDPVFLNDTYRNVSCNFLDDPNNTLFKDMTQDYVLQEDYDDMTLIFSAYFSQ